MIGILTLVAIGLLGVRWRPVASQLTGPALPMRAVETSQPRGHPRLARVVAFVVGVLAGGLQGGIFAVVGTEYVRRWRSRRRHQAAADRARVAAPELVDLLVVSIRAGLTPALAFRSLTDIAPVPLRSAVQAVVARHSTGERFADALGELSQTDIPSLAQLARTLAHAERHGEPLGPTLDRLADDARRERRQQAAASALRLPVRLAFPLVTCTLPSFVVLSIVPLLAGTFISLRHGGL